MRKKSNQNMYKNFSIKDILVVIASIIALTALIFLVKFSNDTPKFEQQPISETGSISNEVKVNGSLSETLIYLTFNEVNKAGWMELYNKEKKAGISLSNYYITVNGVKKYTFPEGVIIEAGEYLCIEGLGRLGTTDHDIIGIFDENGNNLKNFMLPKLESNESYGCRTDGDISYCYLTESKGKTNNKSSIIKKEELAFSVPGGFYDESFQLEITAAEGMIIYYTLDGSEPTNKSEVYKGPIVIENKSGSNMKYAIAEGIEYLYSYQPTSISMGMVVRAIAVGKNGISSEIKTQSYFIGKKNASDIVNLPVLSITTAPVNFFDYFDGIYVSGRYHEDALARGDDASSSANYLNDWVKEVYVEYFEPQKDKTYEGKMSISIIKDISVTSPQKSFLLTEEGGAFPGSSLVHYYNNVSNKLVVLTNRRDNNYKIREYIAGRLLAGTDIGTPEIMPCIVFVNGEYWGGYMLNAQYDEKYIEKHYGVDENEVLIAENGSVTNNTDYQQEYDELYNFILGNDMKVDENYEWVKNHLDIENYLEYFCANMYLANAEYGRDKLVMWRTIKEQRIGYEDGKWRFLMPRLDNTMKNGVAGNVATSSINTYLQYGASQDMFFQAFIRNDEFKKQLGVVMKHMADDVFTEEQAEASISEISGQMKKMVEVSYRRFVGYPGDSFYTNETNKIESFFQQRRTYILRYTEEVISKGGINNVGDNAISE